MSNETYQIISSLYRILGDYDSRQIKAASRQKGLPGSIRHALKALADEAEFEELGRSNTVGRTRVVARVRKNRPSTNGGKSVPSLSPQLPPDVYQENLESFLSAKSRFKNKREIVDFASKLGFSERVDAKDSRKRVERKVVAHAMHDRAFRKNLHELIPNDWAKQTTGWLDLILSEK